ncbi:hypothetical protein VTN02DRAFT_4783 [Thermoascus thermophilus]
MVKQWRPGSIPLCRVSVSLPCHAGQQQIPWLHLHQYRVHTSEQGGRMSAHDGGAHPPSHGLSVLRASDPLKKRLWKELENKSTDRLLPLNRGRV